MLTRICAYKHLSLFLLLSIHHKAELLYSVRRLLQIIVRTNAHVAVAVGRYHLKGQGACISAVTYMLCKAAEIYFTVKGYQMLVCVELGGVVVNMSANELFAK